MQCHSTCYKNTDSQKHFCINGPATLTLHTKWHWHVEAQLSQLLCNSTAPHTDNRPQLSQLLCNSSATHTDNRTQKSIVGHSEIYIYCIYPHCLLCTYSIMQGIMPWNFFKKSLAMPRTKAQLPPMPSFLIMLAQLGSIGTLWQCPHTYIHTYIHIYIKRDHRVGMKR